MIQGGEDAGHFGRPDVDGHADMAVSQQRKGELGDHIVAIDHAHGLEYALVVRIARRDGAVYRWRRRR